MRKLALLPALMALAVIPVATPAAADHTDPKSPLSATSPPLSNTAIALGEGTWTFIKNFPSNPGTDLKFFSKPVGNGSDIFSSSGTLGQGKEGDFPAEICKEEEEVCVEPPGDFVGQRILRLTHGGVVDPEWWADHGSAHCSPGSTSVTGLQHDAAVAGYRNPAILLDTTDAGGRCHDAANEGAVEPPPAGGLELIDISGIQNPNFEPREVHLLRMLGFTHTVTVDATRPWIVYNSSSDFSLHPWFDVLNIRSCLLGANVSLETKRARCRPKIYRVPFADTFAGGFQTHDSSWSQAMDFHYDSLNVADGSAACHDITARPGRLYCAGLNATLIFDVRNITDDHGNVRGTPLACTVKDAIPQPDANTGAKVTDCDDPTLDNKLPRATGWKFLGVFNHPGRDCVFPHDRGDAVTNCNNNNFARADQGVSVSHEADPDQTGKFMFVTDERGGGVVPSGATCVPAVDNPYNNGGAHVFNISNPAHIEYARMPAPDYRKAVYISEAVLPAATFCDIHVMEPVPGEQRFIAAYYSQGTKIVDYHIDQNGFWTFDEVASFTLAGANTWAVQPFKIVRNGNGTETYFFLASDIQRGIDIFKWTGPAAKRISSGGGGGDDDGPGDTMTNAALGGAGALLLPMAFWYRRRRPHSLG